MRKVIIFKLIRDENDNNKILGKVALRVVNVNSQFVGFGVRGEINKAEFKRLADALEPYNDGFDV